MDVPFGPSDNSGHEETVEVEVWECNAQPVDVFRSCQIGGIGAGMGGVVWIGIAADELRAALAIRRVPRVSWPTIADDVQYMGGEVARERNRLSAERASRRGE